MFLYSSISMDSIYMQEPCQIFLDRPAWHESPISHSVNSDVQIYFIYLTSHTALLWFIFITFRVLDSIMTYGRSKHMMKVDEFDRSNFWEGRDINISIFSKKIQLCSMELFETPCCLYSKSKCFRFLPYSEGYISLQAPFQIVVRHLARVGWPVSRSLVFDVCADWIHLTCHNVLLEWFLQFSAFLTASRVIIDPNVWLTSTNSIFWGNRNVNILISSMKIKIVFTGELCSIPCCL
jgi:hypothetical protein